MHVRSIVCAAAIDDADAGVEEDHERVGVELREHDRWNGVVGLAWAGEVDDDADRGCCSCNGRCSS